MNISSAIVKTRPETLERVQQALTESGLCEVCFSDEKGNIVITIEGDDVDEESGNLESIQKLPDILSADLVFAYSEADFDANTDKIEILGPEE